MTTLITAPASPAAPARSSTPAPDTPAPDILGPRTPPPGTPAAASCWPRPDLGRLRVEALLADPDLPSVLDVGPGLLLVQRRPVAEASKPTTTPLVPFEDVEAERREQRRRNLLIGASAVGGLALTAVTVATALA